MKEPFCDNCGNLTSRKELGRKVRGEYLCKRCKVLKREAHREKTIEDAGIKDDLRKLKSRFAKERGYSKKAYAKKVGRPVRKYLDNGGVPIPKGSIIKSKKPKTSCYLTFHERQDLFRMLLSGGMDSDDAKERIQELMDSQEDLRERLQEQNKSEEEIKRQQKKLIEELWQ